jgi:hypothetical protein
VENIDVLWAGRPSSAMEIYLLQVDILERDLGFKKKKKKKNQTRLSYILAYILLISMIIVKPVYESQEHHILYQTFHAQQNERTKQEGTTAQAASPRLNEMNTEIGAI